MGWGSICLGSGSSPSFFSLMFCFSFSFLLSWLLFGFRLGVVEGRGGRGGRGGVGRGGSHGGTGERRRADKFVQQQRHALEEDEGHEDDALPRRKRQRKHGPGLQGMLSVASLLLGPFC